MGATTTITEESLRDAVEDLARQDRDIAIALKAVGPPPLRYRPPGFETLLRIIVAQQVSLASAAAIWGRLEVACPSLDAESVLTLDEDALRACGFSRQKAKYGLSLAELVASGRLDLAAIDRLEDEEAIARLTEVKGLGRWSAEVYLLFSHGRPDVFPAADVGLMIGAQRLKRLDARPNAEALGELAEGWRPLRAVAARMLWHCRGVSALPES
jgi:DNA-3-methyladenine glycosylase II